MYVVLKVQNLNGSRLVIVFLFNEKINRKMKSKRKLLQLEMCWGIFLCNRKLLRNVPITQKNAPRRCDQMHEEFRKLEADLSALFLKIL